MSDRWPKVKLAEVLRQFQEYIDAPEPRTYPKLSVKLYGKGVVVDSPTDGASLKMRRHQLAKAGQVILSEIWGKKGAIGFVPKAGDGALCTSHFFLFDVCADKVDAKWLQAIFQANYLQEQLNAEAKGTTGYAAVRPKILLDCEIPLPPLPEQQRIVSLIERWEATIGKARELRKEAANGAASLVDAKLHAISEVLAKRYGTTQLGNLIVEAGYGSSQKCFSDRSDAAIPVLRIPNVASERIEIGNLKFAVLPARERQGLLLSKGDLLVVRTNGSLDLVGRSAVVDQLAEPTAFASYLIRLRFDDGAILPAYAQRMLRQLRISGQLVDFARTTAGQYNVSLGRLRSAQVPVPPLEEQRKIVTNLNVLEAKVNVLRDLQEQTNIALAAMMPSILDNAFRGKL